jgi:ACS family allantoate permease-like MFS transporter
MPAGAFEFVVMLIITYVCLVLVNARSWCMATALTIALVGSAMVFAAPYANKAALLAGYYLVWHGNEILFHVHFLTVIQIYAFPTGYILLLAMASANVAGHTKKVTTNSLIMIAYSVGK